MPTKQSRHTFEGGMRMDLAPAAKQPNTYDEAHNLRFLADDESKSGELYQPDSSSLLINTLDEDETIIGDCTIRDYLIIWTWKQNDANYNYSIKRYDIGEDTLTNETELYYYTQTLGDDAPFSRTEKLSTLGRYENEDLIKIYWASSDEPIRTANAAEYFTEDGTVYVFPTNPYLDINRFDLISNFSVTGVLGLNEMSSGGLYSGRVQYAVSLYKENNQETVINTLSTSPLNIYSDAINQTPTCKIVGDHELTRTNKGIKLDLSFGTDDVSYFDKYRLYRIHYREYGQMPVITIVNDYLLSSASTTCVDSGQTGLGTYTAEEFSIISGVQYKAYEIEEKDNRLVAANLEEETFDVDFDARAYRFRTSDDVANLYDDNDGTTNEYSIDDNGDLSGGGDWEDIPITAACVNIFNNISNDGTASFAYMFQTDGETLGGEGPNVEYSFCYPDSEEVVLDETAYASTDSIRYHSDTDYSNPEIVHSWTGYQRNEVYRFGIVFINDKGQRSTVKWMGDVRFPCSLATGETTDESDVIAETGTAGTIALPLGINVNITSDLPADRWELVRVPRTEVDKTVLRAGAIVSSYDDGTDCWKNWAPRFADVAGDVENQVVNFINPENVYNSNSVIKEGDYLDIVAISQDDSGSPYYHYNTDNVATEGGGTPTVSRVRGYKFYHYTNSGYTTYTDRRKEIEQAEFVTPIYDDNGLAAPGSNAFPMANASSSETYHGWVVWDGGVNYELASHGRCDVLSLTSTITTSLNLGDYGIGYGYVLRDNPGRYGGYTYSDRQNNMYITCGPSIYETPIGGEDYYGGDTYINYMSYVQSMHPDNLEESEDSITTVFTFPVESTMNLTLAHGNTPTKVPDGFYNENISQFLMQEEAGVHSHGYLSIPPYVQDRDMYLYNTVYSQEQNVKYDSGYYDEDAITNFDTHVAYSDSKLDNENIDSWTKFRPSNYIDVSGKYGGIKKLAKYNNQLYFIQDDAFGLLPINQRSLIQDNNAGILALGTGDILDRYDYINEFYGAQYKESVDIINSGIYVIDKNKKVAWQYNTKGLDVISDSRGMKPYFKANTPESIPMVSGNDSNGEVYMLYNNYVLLYGAITGKFRSFLDYKPTYMGNTNTMHFYQIADSCDLYGLYLHSTNKGSFNGGNSYPAPWLKLTDNAEFLHTKVYDNLIWYSTYTPSGVPSSVPSQDHYDTTFDQARFYTGYQTTGLVPLTIEDNLRKRERQYSIAIPRSISYLDTQSEKSEVAFKTVTDPTKTFKERLRDKFIEATLWFNSDETSDYVAGRFSLAYILFNYRTSTR